MPQYFASALVQDGHATGVLVETHEGRPTKLEGNPHHPASLGATRAIEQAAILDLYDPQRVTGCTDGGMPVTWQAIAHWLATLGDGVQLILEPTNSPIVAELVARVRAKLPRAGVTFWSPLALRASLAGNRLAFGRPLQTQLDLGRADTIVTLDADVIGDHPMALAHARKLADGRRVVDARSPMSRLYVIEPAYTTTGMIADHRFAVRGVEIERVAGEFLAAVMNGGSAAPWLGAIKRAISGAAARAPS